MLDAGTLSKYGKIPSEHEVHIAFVDWIPAICSTREYELAPHPLIASRVPRYLDA